MGLWLGLNWYELSSLGNVRWDKDTALQNWFLSKRSEIVGLNRSGLSALGNVHWEMPVDGKQSLSRYGHHWVSHLLSPSFDLALNESIFYIFNIFTATRQTKSCNGSSFAWLTHWVTSLKLLVSSTSQVSPLDGSVIELFSYSCVHYAVCFWLCTPLVDQLGKACVHLQCWFCPHTHIQNTRVFIHNLHPLEEVCVGGDLL